MKKALFIFICIFALLLGGCADRENTPLGRGFELLEDMEVLINDDDVIGRYSLYGDSYQSEILKLRDVNFSKPDAVFKVTFNDRELLDAVNGEKMSDEVAEVYESRISSSLGSYLNSLGSTESVILASIFSTSSVFDCKKVEENMVYFYVYEDALVAVSFVDGDGDACYAYASIVSNSELDTSDAGSLDDSLEDLVDCDFEVKKVY